MVSLLIGRAVAEVHVHTIRAVRPVAYSDDDGRRKQSSPSRGRHTPCKPRANYLNLKATGKPQQAVAQAAVQVSVQVAPTAF
jgi:hypothetical protein